jgi:hypothetical protein
MIPNSFPSFPPPRHENRPLQITASVIEGTIVTMGRVRLFFSQDWPWTATSLQCRGPRNHVYRYPRPSTAKSIRNSNEFRTCYLSVRHGDLSAPPFF